MKLEKENAMKKFKKMLAAILATATVATTLSTATLVSGNTESDKFNIFRDAGEISDEFMAETSEITQKNWQDNYFSSIVMTLGQREMYVDGTKVDLSFAPALDDDNKLVIPAPELAEQVGAEVRIDEKTGKIGLETENGAFNIDSDAAVSGKVSEAGNVSEIGNAAQASGAAQTRGDTSATDLLDKISEEKITLRDDKSVMAEKADGSITIRHPVVYEEEAERYLGLDVDMQGDRLIISNPYQLREIILYVKNGRNLSNDRGAKEFATNGRGLYFLQYETQAQTRAAYEAFSGDSSIEYVSLNEVVSTASLPSPGSWGTDGTTDDDGNYTSMGIQASRMKNHLAGNNQQIVVAVIDSGADAEYLPGTEGGRQGHIFLSGRTLTPTSAEDEAAGWNFIDNNNDTFDDHGHGTHVSGTIVDCTPDNVKIMPVRVMKKNGDRATGTNLDIGNGIRKAYDNGAQVFNMSIGSFCSSNCYIEQAVDYATSDALSKGKRAPLFVAAAGNESIDTANCCPAKLSGNHTNVVTVSSVEKQDRISGFSNFGDEVDVCAPGNEIFSCVSSAATGVVRNGYKYSLYTGTSMAAPHVTAAVAMLCLDNPTLSAEQIKTKLKGMTVDLGTPGEDPVYGSGRIDFRMLSSNGLSAQQPIAATSLEIHEIINKYTYKAPCSSVTLSMGTTLDDYTTVVPVITPVEATDKSATFTIGDTNYVHLNENGRLQAKAIGSTTVYATKGDLSAQFSVAVLDNWINYAATSYQSGTGTAADPYIIASASQLAKLAYETRVNNNRYYGKYFKLAANIDLGGRNWTPIGAIQYKDKFMNDTESFGGYFDGNGFTISNLYVSVPTNRSWEYCGLFGFVRGADDQKAEIKNLAVTNAWVGSPDIETKYIVGILGGAAFNTEIDSCYTQGNTLGSGFVGWNSVNGIIKNCYANANCGQAGFVNDNPANVTNCYSVGQARKGGFVGCTRIRGTVINCLTNSSVSDLGTGFANKKNDNASIIKGYYSNGTAGISEDDKPETTDVTKKTEQDFKTKSFYTTASNWDSSSTWDFTNTWDIDSRCNNGLPFLRKFQKNVYDISLNKTAISLCKGETEQLTATVLPTYAVNRNVVWSSSNPSAATVDQTGKVTSKATTGTATITATAADGSGVSASCTFVGDTDHWATPEKATTIALHDQKAGKISGAGDIDCFKYVADKTGDVIFYTTGSLDTKGYLLDENKNQIAQNDDASISGRNFAIKYNLQSGKTYYIKVGAYSTNTGSYTLNVARGIYSKTIPKNPDARSARMTLQAASILTNLKIQLGGKTYTITRPESEKIFYVTVNGARFKVSLLDASNGFSTTWVIRAKLPASTVAQNLSISFSKGKITATIPTVTDYLPYKSSIKTNINPSSGLQTVINGMSSSGYSFTVKDWNNNTVTVSSTAKAATGMKIIKTNTSTGKITEIFYVLVYGDVKGGTNCGDGIIENSDALSVLQYATGKATPPNELVKLAADVNHDGAIDSDDALLIQQHAVGSATINQNVSVTNVPDDCYYTSSVAF